MQHKHEVLRRIPIIRQKHKAPWKHGASLAPESDADLRLYHRTPPGWFIGIFYIWNDQISGKGLAWSCLAFSFLTFFCLWISWRFTYRTRSPSKDLTVPGNPTSRIMRVASWKSRSGTISTFCLFPLSFKRRTAFSISTLLPLVTTSTSRSDLLYECIPLVIFRSFTTLIFIYSIDFMIYT